MSRRRPLAPVIIFVTTRAHKFGEVVGLLLAWVFSMYLSFCLGSITHGADSSDIIKRAFEFGTSAVMGAVFGFKLSEKRYQIQKETIETLQQAVEALEGRAQRCDEDRIALHKELRELRDIVVKNAQG